MGVGGSAITFYVGVGVNVTCWAPVADEFPQALKNIRTKMLINPAHLLLCSLWPAMISFAGWTYFSHINHSG